MKTKKVNRYWCDHCGKAGLSAGHMRRHERHCTKNPDRECRMCKMVEKEQQPIERLKGILRNFFSFVSGEKISGELWRMEDGILAEPDPKYTTALNAAVRQVMSITDCPACTMATLRQCGIPVPCATEFDFTMECKKVWDAINDARRDSDE